MSGTGARRRSDGALRQRGIAMRTGEKTGLGDLPMVGTTAPHTSARCGYDLARDETVIFVLA